MRLKDELRRLDTGVNIEIICWQCETRIEGNAIDSGYADEDRRYEDRLKKELADGNPWAWCDIEVVASIGEGLSASSMLGCSSYDSKDDFLTSVHYLPMVEWAVTALRDELRSIATRIDCSIESSSLSPVS